jgi:hypothetical protein
MGKTKKKLVKARKSASANNFSTPDDLSAVKSSWSEEGIICCVRAKLYSTYNDAIKLSKKCKKKAEGGLTLRSGAEKEIVVQEVNFCVECFEKYPENPFFCVQVSDKGLITHQRNSGHVRNVPYKLPYEVKIKWNQKSAGYECDPMDSRDLCRAGRVSLRHMIFEEVGLDYSHDRLNLYNSDAE